MIPEKETSKSFQELYIIFSLLLSNEEALFICLFFYHNPKISGSMLMIHEVSSK